MLPGIRFLLAAIVLSMSILIFGLGAAALLRAAHEEVASVPTRRVMPEPLFAQQVEAPLPTLALLRVEPATPAKVPEALPAAAPAPEPTPEAETEKLAALKLDDMAPAETAKPDVAAKPDTAATETPAPAVAAPSTPNDTKLAALEAAPATTVEVAPVPFEHIAPPALADLVVALKKTAALGSPAAKVEKPAAAKKAAEKPDAAELKKQQRAERAKERRRQAARRARLAAKQAAAAAARQAADPFSQMTQAVQPATTATTTPRR